MAQKQRTIVLALILVVALAGALIYMRTSRLTPTPSPAMHPAPPVTDMPGAETVVEQPPLTLTPTPTDGIYAEAENPPLTLTALRYMPDSGQVALGIPSVVSLLARVMPFAQELLQDDLDLRAEIDAVAKDLAADMDVSDEGGLAGVLDSMGIDSALGMAVFLDIEGMLEELLVSVDQGALGHSLPDMSEAKGVLVIPVNDPENAEASLQKLTGDMLAGTETSEELVGNVTLKIYEGMGAYFVTNEVLAVSNDVALLSEAAARVTDPAQIRYGSASAPPDDIHEAVLLIDGKELIPVLEDAAEMLAELQPGAQMIVRAQIEKMKAIYDDVDVHDPALITLSINEEAIHLQSKMDMSLYPAALDIMGEAFPLRWAQLLPENTLAFLSLCFNPEAKKQITDVYIESLPDELRTSPGVSQGLMYSKPVIDMLGREVTIGLTALDPLDFPSLFIMIELENPSAAQMMLQMAPQQPHGDPYRDIPIKALAVPSPIPAYFALVTNALVVSNSAEGIEGIIDLVKDEETSGFFAGLNPPLDPETPVFQGMLVKPALYADIIEPLMVLGGRNLPGEVGGIFATLSDLFEDLRFFNEMQGDWNVSRLSISRKTN